MFKVGDIVSRNKYNNDILFEIINIESEICYLKGVSVRLYADSEESDLKLENIDKDDRLDDEKVLELLEFNNLDRSDYFYIPGKILHIDADNDYLKRCLKFYKNANVNAYGVYSREEDLSKNIRKYLEDIKPDIVIITGHDAYYKKKGNEDNLKAYKNSENFEKAIRIARKYEKSYDKLKIIAGACQSNYEELINAGANFASSPKRVNIHALDPAIIALKVSLTDINKNIDIMDVIDKTKYGKDGMGGIITKGTMYVGYPRV